MVGLKVGVADPRVVGMVAIGAPVRVYDYGYLSDTEKPILVVQGEEDEFGSGSEARRVLGGLGNHVTVKTVPGSGHLFEGYMEELQLHIRDYFTSGPGHEALNRGQSESGGV
jgi:alpha/beta superfamily hydrolase